MVVFNCPHCGFKHGKGEIHEGDLDGGEHKMECFSPNCGLEFTITVEYEMQVTASK